MKLLTADIAERLVSSMEIDIRDLDEERRKEIFNPERIKDAITLERDEIYEFLEKCGDGDFIVFEKPVRVFVVYWSVRIGSNLCLAIREEKEPGMCYVFAMQNERVKNVTEVLELRREIDDRFYFILGAGYEKGVSYIE